MHPTNKKMHILEADMITFKTNTCSKNAFFTGGDPNNRHCAGGILEINERSCQSP